MSLFLKPEPGCGETMESEGASIWTISGSLWFNPATGQEPGLTGSLPA